MDNHSQMLRAVSKRFVLVFALLFVAGCATSNKGSITQLREDVGDIKIVVLPLDVELSIKTTAGLLQADAEMTEKAKDLLLMSLNKFSDERQNALTFYTPPENEADQNLEYELERLHELVGRSILVHEYSGATLATKKDNWDWSVGPSTKALLDRYDADYGLYLFLRDSYSSTGRVLFTIVAAAAGVGVSGGEQVGFASLVDLRTGDVVWFNLLARGSGNVKHQNGADRTLELLLKDLPE